MTGARLDTDAARGVLDAAVAARAFPGAVAEAGTSDGPLWSTAAGHLTYEPDAPPATDATLYDLASLTKVIATTSVAMRLAASGALPLDTRAARFMPEWTSGPFADVTVRDLLEQPRSLVERQRRAVGRIDLASQRSRLAAILADRTRFAGRYRLDAEHGTLDVVGDYGANSVALSPSMLAMATDPLQSAQGTPLGPIAARLADSLTRAGRGGGEAIAALSLENGRGRGGVNFERLAWRSRRARRGRRG